MDELPVAGLHGQFLEGADLVVSLVVFGLVSVELRADHASGGLLRLAGGVLAVRGLRCSGMGFVRFPEEMWWECDGFCTGEPADQWL